MNRSCPPSFLHIPRTFVGMSVLAEQRMQVTDVGIRASPVAGTRKATQASAAKKMQRPAGRIGNRSWHGISLSPGTL